jgi:hypothetical protein
VLLPAEFRIEDRCLKVLSTESVVATEEGDQSIVKSEKIWRVGIGHVMRMGQPGKL